MLQLMLLQIELLPPQLKSDLASFTNFILDCTAHAIAEKQVVVLMRIVAAALVSTPELAVTTGDRRTCFHLDVRRTKELRPSVLCKPLWEVHLPEFYMVKFGFLACPPNIEK